MKVKYTDSHKYPHGYFGADKTDIRKTFARIRKEQQRHAEETAAVVKPITAAKTSNDYATAASGDALVNGGTRRANGSR